MEINYKVIGKPYFDNPKIYKEFEGFSEAIDFYNSLDVCLYYIEMHNKTEDGRWEDYFDK